MYYPNCEAERFMMLWGRTANLIHSSLAAKLDFPDCADDGIPDEVFAHEIIEEFAGQIFYDYLSPWWEYGSLVLSLARSSSPERQAELDACSWLPGLLPEKLPYDYAEPIVAKYLHAWKEAADIPAPALVRDNNYDMIMGNLLKRSRLSLRDVMDALVREGAVEQPGGVSAARSVGKALEELVARLEEELCWETPAPRNRLEYKALDYAQVEAVVNYILAGSAKSGWAWVPTYEHPLEHVMERVDSEVALVEMGVYEDALSWSDWGWDSYLEPSSAMYEEVEGRHFSTPPVSLFEASAARFVEQLMAAEPSPQVEKVKELLEQAFVREECSVYDFALDIDGEVWADLMSRELYKAVNDAIDDGRLPAAIVDSAALMREIEAGAEKFGEDSYCWLIYRPVEGFVRFTGYRPGAFDDSTLLDGERTMMVTYSEAKAWLDRQASYAEFFAL